ncbi:MAG: MBL fold metallo-hydrolase [Actinomycetes bacterium]
MPDEPRLIAGRSSIAIGDALITVLDDGLLDVPVQAYQSADKSVDVETLERQLLADHDVAVDESANFVVPGCSFVIGFGGNNILIDAGSGGRLPPMNDNGLMINSLGAAGLLPPDIDLILMTHLHPDHVGGLLTGSDHRQFQNAQLMVCEAEWNYWHSDSERARVPDFLHGIFDGARQATAPYRGDVKLFSAQLQELLPSISAVPLAGHTPGHTGFLIESQGDKLLIWGDIIHSEFLEFAHPDWSMVFDVDPAQAIQTRVETMTWAATEDLLVAGMHLGSPAIGHVRLDGEAFAFVPLAG